MILDNKLPLGYLLNSIKYDLGVVLLFGLMVNFLTMQFGHLFMEMPLTIPAFLGTSISILLSFKMNQSYDRWWEARKVWGAIVNDSRTLIMQMQSFFGNQETEMIKKIAYRQIAWCYSLGKSLRGMDAMEDTGHLLSEADRKELSGHKNIPLALLQLNTNDIREQRLNKGMELFYHLQLDNTMLRLCDSMGRAERINGTVFPSTYRQFLHFIIYLFIITLSISLKELAIIYVIPLLLVLSISFFLIEKSAYQLQDPFNNRPSDVPVSAIARTIEINIRQLLGETEVPEPIKPQGFYIL